MAAQTEVEWGRKARFGPIRHAFGDGGRFAERT
jgi:hypothetical protein